jgi:uncharacterized GH25 family protein
MQAVLVGVCYGSSCAAHDFWVEPSDYWMHTDATMPLTLQVGHGPYRQRSPIPLRRIERFEAITPSGALVNLRERLHPGADTEDGSLQFKDPGSYVLVLETDNRAQSHLPAIRFNDYLQAEGLTPAREERRRTGRLEADGSECYSRRAKVIVQVGATGADTQDAVTKPVGLPLEIVPEVNPYAQPRPAVLPIRVLYQGRPLAGALVKLTQLEHDAVPFETHLTDGAGHAVFGMPREGTWLLNVIWTRPLPKTSETDFETVFSSLSFGFPAHRP